jgi:hypothetical protein
MVLFLKRAEQQGPEADTGTAGIHWEPAARFGGLKVSLAWLLGNEFYVFFQTINPGPSTLVDQGRTPLELKRQSNGIVAVRNELKRIAAIADATARAEEAAAYVQSDVWYAKGESLKILGDSGPPALPVIRRILDGDQKWNAGAVQALAKAGGATVAGELTQRLRQEVEFWKGLGSELKAGWWNDSTNPRQESLRARYAYMLQILYALRDLQAAEAKAPVTELRDFWRSHPQLDDKSGLNQMSETCDDTLAAISDR